MTNPPLDPPTIARLRDGLHELAMAAGNLTVATDGQERLRPERAAVLSAMEPIPALLDLADLALAAKDEWQPIEIPPKREEMLLVGFFRSDGTHYRVPAVAASRRRGYPERMEFFVGMQRVHPSHYRPLPSPPALDGVSSND